MFHYASEVSVNTVAFDGEMGKWVLQQLAEEAGVKLQLHSFVTGAVTEGNRVRGIPAVSKSGPQLIEGKLVIDATADARALRRAMEKMDSFIDEKTRVQIMENCGYNCATVNKKVINRAKARRMKYQTIDEFLDAEERKPFPGT